MKIFGTEAFISESAIKNYAATMLQTHAGHMSGNAAENTQMFRGVSDKTGIGTFDSMLKALDNVSDAQLHASELNKQAIINPGSVDIHDLTIAQAEANMALGITRNILSRLVQGWRDLINTR
ncbi:MAG: flagellar hook-basal body complex protein FliE [Treponema sp.]|nr:flagellar hook-basal body complex protein FliE [Treponema sp.]